MITRQTVVYGTARADVWVLRVVLKLTVSTRSVHADAHDYHLIRIIIYISLALLGTKQ